MSDILEAFLDIPYLRGGSTRGGADCWGLVPLVYKETFGVTLPLYNAGLQGRPPKGYVASCVEQEMKRAWEPVEVHQAQFMDVLVLRGFEVHIGIVDANRRFMLTTDKDQKSSMRVEWGRGTYWDERRIEGVYRYVGG